MSFLKLIENSMNSPLKSRFSLSILHWVFCFWCRGLCIVFFFFWSLRRELNYHKEIKLIYIDRFGLFSFILLEPMFWCFQHVYNSKSMAFSLNWYNKKKTIVQRFRMPARMSLQTCRRICVSDHILNHSLFFSLNICITETFPIFT